MHLEQSRKAQGDLDEIRDFSVERFGVARAIGYLDAIEQAFRRILLHPEIGVSRAALGSSIRSLACGRHRIFYEINGETILVLRILHEAMDPMRHL